jgi:Leucine-rich repeat (LRR) protein
LQAQEETVISMTTAMEIDKEIKFRIESEKWVSDTITIFLDFGNGELNQIKIPRINAIFSYDFYLKVKGATIKIYLPSDFIESIHCSKAELTALDVSACKKLRILDCSENLLTFLDISQNINIEAINCSKAELTALDVSACKKLKILNCSGNLLTALNLSKNTQLFSLDCRNNNLTVLDISQNINIESINCSKAELTALDVSACKKLKILDCSENLLTALDLSKNTQLSYLDCWNNNLTFLDVSQNINIESINCSGNLLTALDLSKNTRLSYLDCRDNNLTVLDISQNINLEDVSYDYLKNKSKNPIKIIPTVYTKSILKDDDKLIITMTTNLAAGTEVQMALLRPHIYERDISYGRFDGFKIDYGSGRFVKRFHEEKITFNIEDSIIKIYAPANSVGEIKCSNLQLTSLEVSNCTALENLDCSNNNLTSLDLSQNQALEGLICYQNRIALLDLSHNLQLTRIDCSSNNLSELDLSKNTKLETLDCAKNAIVNLDLSHNLQLTRIDCSSNNLSELDLSKNTKLETLDCTKNAIANLDLSNNLFIYSPKEDSITVVKMPDRRKSEFAQRKDRLSSKYYRRKEKRDYFGFILLGGGYTAMPFTQRDNRSHYQSMWHLNAGIIFNPEGTGWTSSDVFHIISLEGNINFLPMPSGVYHANKNKMVLPSLALSYTLNRDFFSYALDKDFFGMDLKVDVSPYFINPTIGVNLVNFLKLNAGYSFGIKPFHDTLLSGFTIGIAFSMGTYPFCLID